MMEQSADFKLGASRQRAVDRRILLKTRERYKQYGENDGGPEVCGAITTMLAEMDLSVVLSGKRAGGVGHKPKRKRK